jgi:hypothetical protein
MAIRLERNGQRHRRTANLAGPIIRPTSPAARSFSTLRYPLSSFAKPLLPADMCSMASAPEGPFGVGWRIGEIEFYAADKRVQIGGPYNFTSAWMAPAWTKSGSTSTSARAASSTDLALLDRPRRRREQIQTSDDAQPGATCSRCRWLWLGRRHQARVTRCPGPLCARADDSAASPMATSSARSKSTDEAARSPGQNPRTRDFRRRLNLAGGALALAAFQPRRGAGEAFSQSRLQSGRTGSSPPSPAPCSLRTSMSERFPILTSATTSSTSPIPISIPTSGIAPSSPRRRSRPERVAWLNFDGINWKADVFLNGEKLGRIEGGFMRGRFNVTGKLLPGQGQRARGQRREERHSRQLQAEDSRKRRQERRRARRRRPHLSRLDRLGLDSDHSRTQHRHLGRCLRDRHRRGDPGEPFRQHFTLPLRDNSRADISVEVDLVNHSAKAVTGTLRGSFGDVPFEQRVTIEASATKNVKLDPSTHPALRLQKPELWWPVGYGDPHLYDVELSFEAANSEGTRQEGLQSRRSPVHLQRRRRRAAHFHQWPPLRPARRQLGL